MQSSRERERRPGAIGRREAVGRTAGLTLLTTLAACGVLPRYNEPVDLYTLTPKTTFPESLPHVDWQLVVETPVTAASFDTPRIALQRTPLTFEYYANAAWTDNAPSMVQTLLIESFESTRKIGAVGREAIGLRPEIGRGTVRLSVGWHTTEDEVDRAASLLIAAWENLHGKVG